MGGKKRKEKKREIESNYDKKFILIMMLLIGLKCEIIRKFSRRERSFPGKLPSKKLYGIKKNFLFFF